MLDLDSFGGAVDDDGRSRRIAFAVGCRCLNSTEQELNALCMEACSPFDSPPVWLDGDNKEAPWSNADEWEAWFGAPVTLAEAFALQEIVGAEIAERFRRNLIVARDCGRDGTMDEYFLRCEIEGIDPILERKIT